MEVVLIALGVVAILALVVGGILISRHIDKKRTEGMAALAERMGLAWMGTEMDRSGAYATLPLFTRGRSRLLRNAMQGSLGGVDITLFDNRYTVGSGKNQHTHHQTVVAIESSRVGLPAFTCAPENFFHKIGSAFGYQDIDFEAHPEFSKRFLLRGSEDEAIRGVFTPEVLGFFEAHPGVTVEAHANVFTYYRASRRAPIEDIPNQLTDGLALFKALSTAQEARIHA